MNQHNGNREIVGYLFQRADVLIVLAIDGAIRLGIGRTANLLQSVYYNKLGFGILSLVECELFFQSTAQRSCLYSESQSGRTIVCHSRDAILYTRKGILKREVEHITLLSVEAHKAHTQRNANAQLKHQPRLADLRRTAKQGKSFRKHFCHNEVLRSIGRCH